MKIDTAKCIEWFTYNHMTTNKSKFQSMVVSKEYTNIEEFFRDIEFKIKESDTVTLLGVQIVCAKVSLQLNCLKKLTKYMSSNEKLIVINSFVTHLFSAISVILPLFGCSAQGQSAEMGKLNKRALRLALSDYSSSHEELLNKTKLTTVHIHSIRRLALEGFKALHNLNPVVMKDYFIPKPSDYELCMIDTLYIPKVKALNMELNPSNS